jgi:hypothetical protein
VKLIDHALRIIINLLHQCVFTQTLPRSGRNLFSRIGPIVAIMEVEIDFQTSGLSTLSESDVVVEVVVAIGGIDPYALANGVHARGFENGLEGLHSPGRVLIGLSGLFLDEERGPVYAFVREGGESEWSKEEREEA